MSTVGDVVRVNPTKEVEAAMAKATEGSPPEGRGSKGAFYHQRVAELVASGKPVGEASREVAEDAGTTQQNVYGAYNRIAKASKGQTNTHATKSDIPKDLAEVLDSIRKDRASLHANTERLITWAQAQEERVMNAQANAREAALRQIREAAAGLV